MKKFLCSVVAVVVAFSVAGSSYASPSREVSVNSNDQVETNTINLMTNNNEPLGTLITKVTYHREQKNDRVVVTTTTDKHYELLDQFKRDPEKREAFKDTSDTFTIEVTNDDKFYVDGEQIPDSILNQQVNPNDGVSLMSDSGGVPSLGHYYDAGDYTHYYFASYSGMTMGGSPDGSHVAKNTTRSNPYFSQAANTLDILYGDHQSYLWYKASLSAAIVAFPFTLASVIGAIADGGAAGLTAAQLYSYYRDCNSDLSKAYGLISQM
ncbi:hypothetical protein G8C92_28210 [Paenibacillus donghaensis]|uniref:hypothetical protein n=1 Tax=Paenibacillus donghaensis TaxID=414771 RepID=UPI0018841141|nr:hypothetical protein [Paenibacillus donghaensis]MBE9917888.1 hypothetical protein [Paenibacillus donghaensis]